MYKFCCIFLSLALFLASCHAKKKSLSPADGIIGNEPTTESPGQVPDSLFFEALKMYRALPLRDVLSQHWELEEVDQRHWNEYLWDSTTNKKRFNGIYLFKDYSMTKNPRDHCKTGQWSIDQLTRDLHFRYPDGGGEHYFVQHISYSTLDLVQEKQGSLIYLRYLSDKLVHKNPKKDPFFPSNMEWRNPPLRPESGQEIRERTRRFVHFFALFFQDNRKRKEKQIYFSGIPNCFKWYDGGISLQAPAALDRKWVDCFFSEDQAMQGYGMLKTILEKHQLVWPKGGLGWVEELQSVLGQIETQL